MPTGFCIEQHNQLAAALCCRPELVNHTCVSLFALLVTKSSSYSISRTLRSFSNELQPGKETSVLADTSQAGVATSVPDTCFM